MKQTRIRSLLCLLVLCAGLLALAACGGVPPVSEEQIKEDVKSAGVFQEYPEQLEITDVAVGDRQTDGDQKTDTAWVKVVGRNDAIERVGYYKAAYGLYNDGWKLESVEPDRMEQWSYTLLAGPPAELVDAYLPENAVRGAETLDLENGLYTVDYQCVEEHAYCTVTRSGTERFVYEDGWFGMATEDEPQRDWHVEGTYQLVDCETGETRGDGSGITLGPISGNEVLVRLEWMDQEYTGNLIDVRSMSTSDALYRTSIKFYNDFHDYGIRTGRVTNGDWDDICYATDEKWSAIYIGEDHIYRGVRLVSRDGPSSVDEFHFDCELRPV